MDFKFIVLVLVFSAATGEDAVSQKFGSHSPASTKTLSLETIKNKDNVLPSPAIVPEAGKHDSEPKNDDNSTVTSTTVRTDTTSTTVTPAPPDTTTTPKSTTTPKPTTTTSAPTTTTPAPATTTVKPVPEDGTWKVTNSTGGVCIMAKMDLEFNVTYPGSDNSVHNTTIIVPKSAQASGNCSGPNQILELKWGEENSFTILFGLNKTTQKFQILLFNLTIPINSSNASENRKIMMYVRSKPEFPSIPLKMSYKCDKQQMVVLNTTLNKYTASLFISHAQLEAFMTKKNGTFGEANDCKGFDTPDIVPIAVGCVLSILVVVVLIAYVIGRRRSSLNRGYLSM